MENPSEHVGLKGEAPLDAVVLVRERSVGYLVMVGVLLVGMILWGVMQGGRAESGGGGVGRISTYRIAVNEAEAAELQLLPGIGAVIGERIVQERELGGGYRSIDDFEYRVKGIGPVTAGQIEPYIEFGQVE